MSEQRPRRRFRMEMLIQEKQIHCVFNSNDDRDEFVKGLVEAGVIGDPEVIKSN